MARYTIRFFSKCLMRKTEVHLVVPSLDMHSAMKESDEAFYQHDTEKYPLFLMLCGFGDDNEGWLTQGNLQSLCDKHRIAAVSIGGEDKWYLDSSPLESWHTLLEQELPDFLYGNFAKLDRSKKPVICGVSMGGFGALWNGLASPRRYSAIIALSPATRPDGDLNDEARFPSLKTLFLQSKGALPYVHLAVGDQDFILSPSRQLDEWLEENKIGVRYAFVPGYGHSWDFWRVHMDRVLSEMKNQGIV